MNNQILFRRLHFLSLFAGVLFLGSTSVQAQTFLINCGPSTGLTGWNALAGASSAYTPIPAGSQSLVDSTGASTGVTLSVVDNTAGFSWQQYGGNAGATVDPWPVSATQPTLLAASASGDMTLTLTGLNNNASYTFTFLAYCSNGGFPSDTRSTNLTATGSNSGSASAFSIINDVGNPGVGTISGITPNAGVITLVFTTDSGLGSSLNTLQIDTVSTPEPSTFALIILGGCGIFLVAFRRYRVNRS